jgi:hypothetical protein
MKAQHVVSVLMLAVLVLGIVGALVDKGRAPRQIFTGKVSDLLPGADAIPGWSVEQLNAAESPEAEAFVRKALRYDDVGYVSYSRGDVRISIFITYWAPGKISWRLGAQHTPDICWVNQGWECSAASSTQLRSRKGMSWPLPVEQRTFHLAGRVEHVVFTHLLDGEVINDQSGPMTWWRGIYERFLGDFRRRPTAEQFFVRISSDRPLEDFASAAPVELLLRALEANYLQPVNQAAAPLRENTTGGQIDGATASLQP